MKRLRHYLKAAVLSRLPNRPALPDSILVCGSPRSGTTWLAEILTGLPRSAMLFEPLHLDRVPAAGQAGCQWRTFKSESEDWPAGKQLFEKILTGRLLNRWILSQTDFRSMVRARRYIVKCVRANRLLPWLSRNFPEPHKVLVVRHPCSVIASQMAQGSWQEPRRPETGGLSNPLAQFVDSLRHPEELLAAEWAIDNHIALSATSSRCEVVSYESLVLNTEETVTGLLSAWGIERPEGFPADTRRASAMTTTGRAPASGAASLSKWKTELTAESIARITSVVRTFGFDPDSSDAIAGFSGRPDPELVRA